MQLRSPARWADSHIDMYVACVIRGLCSSAGRWSYGVVSPVTGRVRPLTRSTAPRPEGGPPFPRAGARRPLRTTVGDVRQLRGGGLGYGFAGRGWAGRYGQRCGFRRFAAGGRLSPARTPSMP